jgi:hypothetical protein
VIIANLDQLRTSGDVRDREAVVIGGLPLSTSDLAVEYVLAETTSSLDGTPRASRFSGSQLAMRSVIADLRKRLGAVCPENSNSRG